MNVAGSMIFTPNKSDENSRAQANAVTIPAARPGSSLCFNRLRFPGLVRLTAKEGRDLKLIVIHRLLHRKRRAAVHVETLRGGRSGLRPFGVFQV